MNRDDLTYILNNMLGECRYVKFKTSTCFILNKQ